MAARLRLPVAAVVAATTLAVPSYAAGEAPHPATAARATQPTGARPPIRLHRVAVRHAGTVLRHMTLPQRVGQLFMVGTPATYADSATLAAISGRHVGNVMLTGRTYAGAEATARVTGALQARASMRATRGVDLLVSTDQEGGLVQVVNGPGISDMPSALTQGGWRRSRLHTAATTWGGQLRAAGIDMDLAPVVDVVPGPDADNPPIGAFDREFGYTPRVVARHGRAFVTGMAESGVLTSAKHFPGLGRVHANTDTSSGVTDTVTRRHDPYLRPFQAAVDAGTPFVMMSTAYYRRLDPHHPAAFSPFVIGTVLRHDLGFHGAVISDDLANAAQVAAWSPGRRAVKFLGAGGTMVLTVSPGALPAMYDAVLARARHSHRFLAKVDAAALTILRIKESHGLL